MQWQGATFHSSQPHSIMSYRADAGGKFSDPPWDSDQDPQLEAEGASRLKYAIFREVKGLEAGNCTGTQENARPSLSQTPSTMSS
eukprot:CAMPEP_0174385578 /NCGR_PEP_ID=MMETSP0811_2-20130205/126698_1 /TAXON_ID=73025 ORGANISM="Eutreptiella gymnastica-like, Strain CCMP1594" /NCGR_SAMPLE_ID=MMETSP0811_2 /ASSEMBLY_ACC=CAM_ASM_000667 /LENGTH=84 /DNA_ID=CAMNT_0015539951 /DNA_START=365 /DNA_END=619 /DNA_ORIENTATION=-